MGSFVVLHATKVRPDPNKFKALPKKLDCAFYSDDETGAFYIDTFVAGKKKEWPSAWTIYTKDIPLDLPVALEPLNVVYGALSKKGFSHDYSFERGFINLNLLLSQIHGHSVCSICGDDDTLDLACISTCGRLDRLRFEAEELERVINFSALSAMICVRPLPLRDLLNFLDGTESLSK